LHVLIGYATIFLHETITEGTEKWATPTFLLVIHSAAGITRIEIGLKLVKPLESLKIIIQAVGVTEQ
jgi:hypothetical protein